MADSTGISATGSAPLSDWAHVQQSIRTILTTRIGTRVMRRDFGSDLPDLIDAKMTQRNVLAVYSAAALAIARWEPRFRMRRGSIDQADASGVLGLTIYGTYFPRGHLADFSVSESAVSRVVFGA